ncbi:MAG: endolytic transglycosylase MltG [Vicingaceae bacterium]
MIRKIFLSLIVIIIGIALFYGYKLYQKIYAPSVETPQQSDYYFYIHTGDTFEDVINNLFQQHLIDNKEIFKWIAEKKNYPNNVHPGRYLLKNKMSNNELINLLRSGNQTPVKVTFHNVRTKEQLAGKITKNLEADSARFLTLLNDESFVKHYGFNTNTILTMFLPNTYEMYWNTNEEALFEKMAKEYKKFWTEERKQKPKNIGLSQSEVSILASIVEAEQRTIRAERPKIAGLYINRLKKGMLLQSDPTVIYAMGDFTINRVLTKHLTIDSPYNTYKYKGLPPGPILLPSINSIDAVLNYEHHNYIYMCAKEDFSGYHAFATNLREHAVNARKFQQALNKRRIYK